jgi:hypothetical protein
MGDMLLVENTILPVGLKTYGIARDTEMNKMFRDMFSLPEPLDLIKIMIETEVAMVDEYVISWYESYKRKESSSG